MNNNNMMIDENMMRVKNIVEPYEKKIKELEEIIRQKDFEISILKDKLFNFNKNQLEANNMGNFNINNNLNMNMNINMNNQLMNPVFGDNIIREINVKFIDENNKETTIKFSRYSKTRLILEKYSIEKHSDFRQYIFTFNNKSLVPGFTLEKNGLINNSIIFVKKKKLLGLMFDYKGKLLPLVLYENTSISMAVIYFLLEIDREDLIVDLMNGETPLHLIFNACTVNIRDNKTIKQYFIQNNVKIFVTLKNDVIG